MRRFVSFSSSSSLRDIAFSRISFDFNIKFQNKSSASLNQMQKKENQNLSQVWQFKHKFVAQAPTVQSQTKQLSLSLSCFFAFFLLKLKLTAFSLKSIYRLLAKQHLHWNLTPFVALQSIATYFLNSTVLSFPIELSLKSKKIK